MVVIVLVIQDSIEDQALTEDSDGGFVDASETEHEIEASEVVHGLYILSQTETRNTAKSRLSTLCMHALMGC
ncbi:hypothetical protein AB3S75_022954 [Citrus x aurantiifolia]